MPAINTIRLRHAARLLGDVARVLNEEAERHGQTATATGFRGEANHYANQARTLKARAKLEEAARD